MKEIKSCKKNGCNSQDFSFWLYNGKQFCKDHYTEVFLNELYSNYHNWDGVGEPPNRLKYLIGRYYAEHEIQLIRQPSLTKAIVHERSYSWEKNGDEVIFTVIRFPVSYYEYDVPRFDEVHQKWMFNLNSLTFTFLSET